MRNHRRSAAANATAVTAIGRTSATRRRLVRAVLLTLTAALLPAAVDSLPAGASPSQEYSGPYFGNGNLPPGCIRDLRITNPDNICHHMRTGYNGLDSPQVDVLVLVPVSPTAERDARIIRQSVEMWEGGIDYLAEQMGLDWLADGVDFHITVTSVDPTGADGEFTTYPIADPEIVVVATNPVGTIGQGNDPVANFTKSVPTIQGQSPCHGVQNPFDFEHWESLPGFDSHHGSRSGTYVEDCGGAGGNICFAVNTASDAAPEVGEGYLPLFDLVAHEFGHCLSLGHVGDAEDGVWGVVPTNDIMAYSEDPGGSSKCVSTLDVEGIAIRMSRHLDVNGDGAVDGSDLLVENDPYASPPNGAPDRLNPAEDVPGSVPMQIQHPSDHLYASGTGLPEDCPQPDLGLFASDRTDWTPTPVDTTEEALTILGPQHGAVSDDGAVDVTGTVDRRSAFDPPTGQTGSRDDASDDARTPATELLRLDVEAGETHLDATLRLADLPATATLANDVTYTLVVNGLKITSSLGAGALIAPVNGARPVVTYPSGTSHWDTEADTVSFHIPYSLLASFGVRTPYQVAAYASFGASTLNVFTDDHVPGNGESIGVAAPGAAAADTCSAGCPAGAERVRVYVDGAVAGSESVDTAVGPDSFSIPVDLAEGTHELRVEWEDGGELVAARSLTFTHNTDDDGDGVENAQDACPSFDDEEDRDRDSVPDGCDADLDGDGMPNAADNCAERANPGQADMDGDGLGDACDEDIDGDGHSNAKEAAHGTDPADPASYPGSG